jgi:Leucine-rich repeat (LRR) protein/GTPase SAR1 family protein
VRQGNNDSAIIELLKSIYGIIPNKAKYDEQNNLITLDLSNSGIVQVPEELWQLSSLHMLDLSGNKLREMPGELGLLRRLRWLYLQENKLRQVPEELGQLSNLQVLYLQGNKLRQVPRELGQLRSLRWLYLQGNKLRQVPRELEKLSNLQRLYLRENELRQVPWEIGQLSSLQELDLSENKLTQVPGRLGQLSNLQVLYLDGNELRQVPWELGKLSSLRGLNLSRNKLTQVPWKLGKLSNLQWLDLRGNELRQIPERLGQLSSLQELAVDGNPLLLTPPPEIISQGTHAMLAFLRELHQQSVLRYEAKLIFVGEAGTGKSSLLRALNDKEFDASLKTTHGIEVDSLLLPHPSLPTCTLTLNTWDFGGQDIYRATHQFFLTKRSLYLVVWNARLGGAQGRLDYWLSTIRALAPDVPVLLVTTHIDERAPDLNIPQYRKDYSQIVEVLHVSNKTNAGINELKQHIARHAAQLPLMGQPWPQSWIKIEQKLVSNSAHHISAGTYIRLCAGYGVQATLAQGTLGSYLHDLGKILYFRDDPILSGLVILKPNWVTKAISLVLEDEATRKRQGILEYTELARIWTMDEQEQPYDSILYPIFLRLMERFDLCYQIEPAKLPVTCSLIPQLLPFQPPSSLPVWSAEDMNAGKIHVEMTYRLDFLPAGIMSWFIVRTHRYTHHLHWREGVVLTYNGHFARVELFPRRNEIHIEVWGVEPRMFLVILKDTLDLILDRFEGLQIRQEVPCICHQLTGTAQSCPEVYDYEKQLIKRLNQGVETIQCNESFREVNVRDLLYGLHVSTIPQVQAVIVDSKKVIQSLEEMRSKDDLLLEQNRLLLQQNQLILERLNQLAEWQVRQFIRRWNLEMQRIESECPSTFMLIPSSKTGFNPKNWVGTEYKLFVMCQYPSEPHCVHDSQGYNLRQPRKWWVAVSPWLKHLITFLKYGVSIAGVPFDIGTDVYKQIDNQVGLLDKIVEDIPDLDEKDSVGPTEVERSHPGNRKRSSGAALRVLHSFLKEADPDEHWDGLRRVITEDGNIFWLCEKHAYPYRVQPLQIR